MLTGNPLEDITNLRRIRIEELALCVDLIDPSIRKFSMKTSLQIDSIVTEDECMGIEPERHRGVTLRACS